MKQINSTTFQTPELGDLKPTVIIGGKPADKFIPNVNISFHDDEFFINLNRKDKLAINSCTNPVELSGINTVTLTIRDGSSNNIVGAHVYAYDSAGTTFYEHKISNSSGQVVFNMDDGTYIIKVHGNGYTFMDTTLTVSGATSQTITGTAFTITAPDDPNLCRVWIKVTNPKAAAYTTLTATAMVIEYISGNILSSGKSAGVYDSTTKIVYWDIVRLSSAVVEITELSFRETITVPNVATSELDDLLV